MPSINSSAFWPFKRGGQRALFFWRHSQNFVSCARREACRAVPAPSDPHRAGLHASAPSGHRRACARSPRVVVSAGARRSPDQRLDRPRGRCVGNRRRRRSCFLLSFRFVPAALDLCLVHGAFHRIGWHRLLTFHHCLDHLRRREVLDDFARIHPERAERSQVSVQGCCRRSARDGVAGRSIYRRPSRPRAQRLPGEDRTSDAATHAAPASASAICAGLRGLLLFLPGNCSDGKASQDKRQQRRYEQEVLR